MGMNEVIAGLDIGTSKVSIVVGEIGKGDGLQVTGVGTSLCTGMEKGMIVDMDNTSGAIASALKKAEYMSNKKIAGVYVNISSRHVRFVRSRGTVGIPGHDGVITHEHVYEVTEETKKPEMTPDSKILDILPVQYIVDGYGKIADPVGMEGSRLELEADVLVASTTIINTIERCVKNAGLEVKGLILEPLADASAVLTKDEMEQGCVLVNVGAGKTELGIFQKGLLKYVKYIPVGGDHISNDLSVGLNINFKLAEGIKRKYGLWDSDLDNDGTTDVSYLNYNQSYDADIDKQPYDIDIDRAREIMLARVQEMFAIIKHEIKGSGYGDNVGSRVVLTGGGLAMLQGAVQVGEEVLGQTPRIGKSKFIGATSPIYSLAVGLVKYIYENTYKRESSDFQGRVTGRRYRRRRSKKAPVFVNKIKQVLSDFF